MDRTMGRTIVWAIGLTFAAIVATEILPEIVGAYQQAAASLEAITP